MQERFNSLASQERTLFYTKEQAKVQKMLLPTFFSPKIVNLQKKSYLCPINL